MDSCIPECVSREFEQNWNNACDLKKNLTLDELKRELKEFFNNTVYVYVVSTTYIKKRNNRWIIIQKGTGPNFEGCLLTLTNCKHSMRCNVRDDLEKGKKVWIAGFTSKNKKKNPFGKYFLFYLMKIGHYEVSFRDLWYYLARYYPGALNVKNACKNPLGDIYKPKSDCNNPYNPNCYLPPIRDQNIIHVHHRCTTYQGNSSCQNSCNKKILGCWRKDISYICKNNNSQYPALLIGDKNFSYLWSKPLIQVDFDCLLNVNKIKSGIGKGIIPSQKILRDWIAIKLIDLIDCCLTATKI